MNKISTLSKTSLRVTLLQSNPIVLTTYDKRQKIYFKTYTALSLYLSRVKCRVLRELVLSNCVK